MLELSPESYQSCLQRYASQKRGSARLRSCSPWVVGYNAKTMQLSEHPVFSQLSPDNKVMTPGFNARVFTGVDSQRGDSIRCDFATGAITLAPGSYHITGFSIATYNSGGEPAEMTTVRAPAAAGYCRLRTYDPEAILYPSNTRGIPNDDPTVLFIGSPCTAKMPPSLFEAYHTTGEEFRSYLSTRWETILITSSFVSTLRIRSGMSGARLKPRPRWRR